MLSIRQKRNVHVRSMSVLSTVRQQIVQTLQSFSADNAERLAAALAFYATFSLAPLLVLMLSVAGLLYGRQSDLAQEEVMTDLTATLGPDGTALIEGLLEGASAAPGTGLWATILSGLVLVVGATALFARLQDALNTIWKATPTHTGIWGFLWSRGQSLLLVLGAGALLVGSLVLQSLLVGMADVLAAPVLLRVGGPAASLVLLALLIGLLYRVLPDTTVRWMDVWPGALLAAVLVTLGTWALGWYLGTASVTSPYGAAGSLAAFLLWIYYSAQIFFLGAELTTVRAGRASGPIPAAPSSPALPPADRDSSPPSRWPARLGWIAVGVLLARLFRGS